MLICFTDLLIVTEQIYNCYSKMNYSQEDNHEYNILSAPMNNAEVHVTTAAQ